MLRYSIEILKKVSFHAELFKKELLKAIQRLLPNEVEILKRWLRLYVMNNPELAFSLRLIP